jgi:Ca-activated chloride channel family protein
MSFIWPWMLASLLAVPMGVFGYVRLLRSRAAQQSALGMMGTALTRRGARLGWRRHAPFTVFTIGTTLLLIALARPEATVEFPRREGTVILAFDVSNSMRADDLLPTRLHAAKDAARRFVASQPKNVEIGVVAFSTAAFEVQPPTQVRADVLAAIRRLRVEGGTSLGRGIGASINAIARKPIVPEPDGAGGRAPRSALRGELPAPASEVEFLGSSAVILLTDGEDTTDFDPLEATQVAAQAGVRIFPIGLGSTHGAVIDVDGYSVATRLDEELLREIADLSNGQYFRAEDAATLRDVYDAIDLKFRLAGEKTEVTALLAGGAIVLFLIGAAMSARWLGRVP